MPCIAPSDVFASHLGRAAGVIAEVVNASDDLANASRTPFFPASRVAVVLA